MFSQYANLIILKILFLACHQNNTKIDCLYFSIVSTQQNRCVTFSLSYPLASTHYLIYV